MAGWLAKRLGNGLFGLIDIDSPSSPPAITIGADSAGLAKDSTLQNLSVQSSPSYQFTQQTFTGTGSGAVVDITTKPLKSFSIAVKGTGAGATSWTVVLEGSLDGTNFTTLLTHNTAILDGVLLALSSVLIPVRYLRITTSALVLGTATNIVVSVLGA